MPNTSSASLDVSSLLDEIEVKPDGFTQFAEEVREQEFADVHAAARWARKYDPQSYARAAELAPEVPPEIGVRQLGLLENSAKLAEYKRVLEHAPALRGYFAERPKDLAYANPDELDNLSGLTWAGAAFPLAIAQGVEQARGMYAGFAMLEGTATPEQAAAFQAYRDAEWRSFGARGGWGAEALVNLGQSLPGMGAAVAGGAVKALQYGTVGGLVGGGLGAVAGGVGAGPGSLVGMGIGARVGGAVGAFEQNYKMLAGQAYAEFLDFKDENGNGLDPQVARWAALLAGVTGAGMETLGESATLGLVPGLDKILGNFTLPGLKKLLGTGAGRAAFTNLAVNLGSAVTVETLTEVGQEAMQIFSGELAKYASEGEFAPITGQEAMQRLTDAGVGALQVMSILGPLASGTRFGADLREMIRSKRENAQFENIITTLSDNGLVERAPEVAAKLIDKQLEDKKIYINAAEARELYQSQGLDLYGPALPNWRQRVDEALASGGDIVVSVGEYASYLSRNPKENPLGALVRTNPEGYSVAETQALAEAQAILMQSELGRAQAVSAEMPASRAEAAPIELFPEMEELRNQIKAIGFQPAAVDHLTAIFSSFYTTMAHRTGQSPSELFADHALEIRRSLLTIGKELSAVADPNTFFQTLYRGLSPTERQSFEAGNFIFRPNQVGIFTSPERSVAEGFASIKGNELYETEVLDELKPLRIDSPEFLEIQARVDPDNYEKSLREALLAQGYNALDRSAELGYPVYEVLDPELLRRRDIPSPLYQDRKGSISFQDSTALIQLFDGHDMSTLLHEAGHFYLQTFKAVKDRSPELAADWALIKKHLKIGDDDKITREQHERFARMTEAYFMEGKAPAPELRPAFEAFRQWLKTLYRRISQLGGKVSPEIRGVFDRMLVTDQRTEQLAADTAYAPLFASAEEMGVTPEEYLQYQQLVEDLRKDAQDGARNRVVGQIKRSSEGWRRQILSELTKEAEEKLRLQPPYKHLEALKEKKLRIDAAAFAEKTSVELRKKFPRAAFVQNGIDPEIAAELFGYPTLDEFLFDVQQALPIKEAAKLLAQQEMARRFEADFDNKEIMDLAIKQQLNAEGRTFILAKEFKALSQKAGRTVSEAGPRQLATTIARDSLYRRKVGEVNEAVLNAAVRRAAREAETATIKGEWAKAADAKRKQLLAQALANEGAALSARIQRIRDKAARYSRKASDTIHPSYMEQIRGLVEQYEFRTVSGKKLKRRVALRDFIAEQEAEDPGQVFLQIPDRLLRETERINYKELSVEDLIAIGDTLDNLEHLGRVKQKLRTAQGQREFAELKNAGLSQLRSQVARPALTKWSETEGTAMHLATSYLYSTLKPERLVEWLDLGEVSGFFTQHVFEPIAAAEVARNDLNAEFSKKIIDTFNEVSPKYFQEQKHISSLDETLSRENIYAIALNVGNESNRRKLLEGELWSEAQLNEVLSHMTKEDWDRVQKLWDILDGLWGKIEALEKRLTGVAPPKIEAREVHTPYGNYRGGYYPVVYDFKARRGLALLEDVTPLDKELSVNDIFQPNQHMTPGTDHKHTIKRTKAAKPISRELAVLPKHMHRVIHDLTHREAIRAVYKILWDPDIKNEIIRVEGEHAYEQLQFWLRAVATEYAPETDPIARHLGKLRVGATTFAMGYRLTTAAAQALGWFNSLRRVNPRYLGKAVIEAGRRPVQTIQMVNDLSGELRHRFNQQDYDLRNAANRITLGKSKFDLVRDYAFYHIAFLDKIVASTTWLGAYSEYLDKHGGDEQLARQHADRTVRLSQGTGNAKDAARVVNSSEYSRLFTMFYSAFSAIHNEIWDLTRQTKDDITNRNFQSLLTRRLAEWTVVVALPAVLGPLVSGQGPEEDENYAWWATKQVMLYPLVGLPLIRDVAGAIESGFDFKMTPVQKVYENTVRAWDKVFEGDFTEAIKPLASALSVVYRFPGGQFINTTEAILEGNAQGDFEPQDLIYGRRGK